MWYEISFKYTLPAGSGQVDRALDFASAGQGSIPGPGISDSTQGWQSGLFLGAIGGEVDDDAL